MQCTYTSEKKYHVHGQGRMRSWTKREGGMVEVARSARAGAAAAQRRQRGSGGAFGKGDQAPPSAYAHSLLRSMICRVIQPNGLTRLSRKVLAEKSSRAFTARCAAKTMSCCGPKPTAANGWAADTPGASPPPAAAAAAAAATGSSAANCPVCLQLSASTFQSQRVLSGTRVMLPCAGWRLQLPAPPPPASRWVTTRRSRHPCRTTMARCDGWGFG